MVTPPSARRVDAERFYQEEYTLTATVRASTERHRYFRYPEYQGLLATVLGHAPQATSWLDVGCDHGFFLDEVRRYGLDVTGVEPGRRGRRYAASIGLVVHDDLSAVTERHDIVSCWHVLEHIAEPRTFLAQCAERLTPNGLLALRVPDAGSRWARHLKDRWIWFQADLHLVHYDAACLRTLVEAAGFQVVMLRRQRPNTMQTVRSFFLAAAVFRRAAGLPRPSLRDVAARLYQDITASEVFLIARKR